MRASAIRRLIPLCLLAAFSATLPAITCHVAADDQKQPTPQPSAEPPSPSGPILDLPGRMESPALPQEKSPKEGPQSTLEDAMTRGVIIRVIVRVPCNLDPNIPREQDIVFTSVTAAGIESRLRLLYRGTTELGQGERNFTYENFERLPLDRYRVMEFPGVVEVRDWGIQQPAYSSSPACRQRRRAGPLPPSITFFAHLDTLDFEVGPRTVAIDFQATLRREIGEIRLETAEPQPCPKPPCM